MAEADNALADFTAFDRKVYVIGDESDTPSLYALVRSWARNGAPPDVESDGEDAETIHLPASAPAHNDSVHWPRECFTSAYETDKNQNMASIYKAAWVAAHRHYCKHREEQRTRHAARHMALLEIAQEKAKAQAAVAAAGPAEGPWQRNPRAAATRQAALQAGQQGGITNLTGQWWVGHGASGSGAAHNLATHNLSQAKPAAAAADTGAQDGAGQASRQGDAATKAGVQSGKRARTEDSAPGSQAADEDSPSDEGAKGNKAAKQS